MPGKHEQHCCFDLGQKKILHTFTAPQREDQSNIVVAVKIRSVRSRKPGRKVDLLTSFEANALSVVAWRQEIIQSITAAHITATSRDVQSLGDESHQ